MHRNNISILLCLAAAACLLTGCASSKNGSDELSNDSSSSAVAETSTSEADSITDYHTIQPPEEGWTTEELMSVTYLYGRQLTYPLTLGALGDSIELKNMEPNIAGNVHVTLCHGDQIVGNAIFNVKTVEEVNQDTPIDQFMFLGDQNTPNSLVINGKSIDTEFENMQGYLGETVKSSESSKIFYKTKGDSFTIAAINSNGVFSALSLYGMSQTQ